MKCLRNKCMKNYKHDITRKINAHQLYIVSKNPHKSKSFCVLYKMWPNVLQGGFAVDFCCFIFSTKWSYNPGKINCAPLLPIMFALYSLVLTTMYSTHSIYKTVSVFSLPVIFAVVSSLIDHQSILPIQSYNSYKPLSVPENCL